MFYSSIFAVPTGNIFRVHNGSHASQDFPCVHYGIFLPFAFQKGMLWRASSSGLPRSSWRLARSSLPSFLKMQRLFCCARWSSDIITTWSFTFLFRDVKFLCLRYSVLNFISLLPPQRSNSNSSILNNFIFCFPPDDLIYICLWSFTIFCEYDFHIYSVIIFKLYGLYLNLCHLWIFKTVEVKMKFPGSSAFYRRGLVYNNVSRSLP